MLLISVVGLPGLQGELGELDAVRIMLARFGDQRAPPALRADAVQILSRLCDQVRRVRLAASRRGRSSGPPVSHSRLLDSSSQNATNQDSFRRADGIVALVDEIEEYCRTRAAADRVKAGGLEAAGLGGLSGSATEKAVSYTHLTLPTKA